MTSSTKRVLVILVGLVVVGGAAQAQYLVDDFEQDNWKTNTMGHWSDLYVPSGADGGFMPDAPGANRLGSLGAVLYYSNSPTVGDPCKFYTVVDESSPYLNLSGPWHVRFWIKTDGGAPAIEHVILESGDPSAYGRVRFADYNSGAAQVLPDWREISIPVGDFLGDTGGTFSLAHVSLIAFTFATNSSVGSFSSVSIDHVLVSPEPAPDLGLVVTNDVTADDFDQANGKPNTLGLWSDLYVDTNTSSGVFVPDAADAKKSGGAGAKLLYRNGPAETEPCKFYTTLSGDWPFVDVATHETYVRFWVYARGGTPEIDRVILEGGDPTRFGRVRFRDYNGGQDRVRGDWNEISIPAADFLGSTGGGFSLSNAAMLAFTFVSDSSTETNSEIWIDEIVIATSAAPGSAGAAVTNTVMIDDFEQNNDKPNTLGYWANIYADEDNVTADFLPDFDGAQRNGSRGGVLYYSNSLATPVVCLFYTPLHDTWPYVDLSQPGLHLRFWVKAAEGTPGIDTIALESGVSGRAEVRFADWGGEGVGVPEDWREISIPVTNFLAGANEGFTLTRVSKVVLDLSTTTSVGYVSSFYVDDIQVATNAAPPPPADILVTNTLVIDDFEQNNDKPNTLGHWSNIYFDEWNGSYAGFMPDNPGAAQSGSNGGILFYSNSVTEGSACKFYSVLRAEDGPCLDLTATDLYVRFWVKANEGTPAIDQVLLEGRTTSRYARVSFADFNGGTACPSAEWMEISIPVSNLLEDASDTFLADKVAVFAFTLVQDSSTDRFSSLYLDNLTISPEPAPPPVRGVPVTAALMVDDFEQGNGQANTLGLWCNVYVGDAGSVGGVVPDLAGVQMNGARGGVLYYSNAVPESSPSKFYTIMEDDWPYLDLEATNLYVRFWVKANEGTPAIDQVFLEGRDYTQYGRVDFAPWNGGTKYLAPDWNEICIPVTNFLKDTGGGFMLSRVSVLALTFVSNSAAGTGASMYVDDFQVSPLEAAVPSPDRLVEEILLIDDFEQGNGEANTLGLWANVSCNVTQSFVGFIPDFANVQYSGTRGGVVFYSNSVSATVPCLFYSLLSESWPYVDMAATNLAVQFHIRKGDGTPVMSQVILQGDHTGLVGRVDFADYNGGAAEVASEWRQITIPVTGFLGDATAGFTPERVKMLAMTMDTASSVGSFSAVWLDDLRVIAMVDADGDGDYDASDPDDDNDGMPDTWEDDHFGGRTNAEAHVDSDGDGTSNLDECLADTDPWDTNSVFVIRGFSLLSPPTLTFPSSAARTYDVDYSTNLLTGQWTSLAAGVAGDGGMVSVPDPGAGAYRVYRVRTSLP